MPTGEGRGDTSASDELHTIVLIGTQPEDRAVEKKSEELLDGFIVAMQEFDTETLLAIAEWRERVNPDGWMQQAILGYVDVWR